MHSSRSLGIEHVMDGIQLSLDVLCIQIALLLHLLEGLARRRHIYTNIRREGLRRRLA